MLVLAALSASSCASGDGTGPPRGAIEGTVLAGPTCPVERVGQECSPRPVVDREVTISRGSNVVEKVTTDNEGRFGARVPPGRYTLGMEQVGIESGRPTSVRVRSGRTSQARIDVDTGIR